MRSVSRTSSTITPSGRHNVQSPPPASTSPRSRAPSNLAEFDSRPGPVRDALFRDQRDWLGLLAGEPRAAVDAGEITDLDVELAAFQLDAVLCAANTALRLDDKTAVTKVRRVMDGLLTPPAQG